MNSNHRTHAPKETESFRNEYNKTSIEKNDTMIYALGGPWRDRQEHLLF